jgi:hypothetical protein
MPCEGARTLTESEAQHHPPQRVCGVRRVDVRVAERVWRVNDNDVYVEKMIV